MLNPSSFDCPTCHAKPGERCLNKRTGNSYHRGAHHSRLVLAFPESPEQEWWDR